jgi:uncharacterized protein YjiS (DUF1127 family)
MHCWNAFAKHARTIKLSQLIEQLGQWQDYRCDNRQLSQLSQIDTAIFGRYWLGGE